MAYPFNGLGNLGNILQTWGVVDVLLPFILVFTISYAVLQKSGVLGQDAKNFNVVVALVLGLLFIVPHVIGAYPVGYDPVVVLTASLPSISLVAVASIMLLLLLGIFGGEFKDAAMPFIVFGALAFVVYIFGSSLNFWTGPYDIFGWWTQELTQLLIIILIFGLIVKWITKDPNQPAPSAIDSFTELLKKFAGKKS